MPRYSLTVWTSAVAGMSQPFLSGVIVRNCRPVFIHCTCACWSRPLFGSDFSGWNKWSHIHTLHPKNIPGHLFVFPNLMNIIKQNLLSALGKPDKKNYLTQKKTVPKKLCFTTQYLIPSKVERRKGLNNCMFCYSDHGVYKPQKAMFRSLCWTPKHLVDTQHIKGMRPNTWGGDDIRSFPQKGKVTGSRPRFHQKKWVFRIQIWYDLMHPRNLTWKPENNEFQMDFPFPGDLFSGSMLNFGGVGFDYSQIKTGKSLKSKICFFFGKP